MNMILSTVWSFITNAALVACFWPFMSRVEPAAIAQYQMNSMGRGGMQSGYCPDGLHPNPNDCQSFYNCAHGQQYQQQCGPGTVFNPYNQVCDWPNPSICQDYSTCAPCYGSQGQGYYGGSSIDNQYSGYAPGESQAYGQQNYGPDYTQNY